MQRGTIGTVANAQQTAPLRDSALIASSGIVVLPLPERERAGTALGIALGS